ncbi:MAG: cell wall metabolism sensor histidine kinase WalK [Ferruginibacter sp.]|uniref:sensor histidine kinase n=1 Tax=Ferruginibacter sp. TaxID=1940288 RepID=UPI002659CB69|nr:ATP-binding protein [Ferruginibacter sp.]MDB5278857.1 cell wall metabolism sensor histidine kinase WalK [Ferruginibacter sp.]
MKLKTKLSLGLSFLFAVIVAFGILGFFYINRLSNDSDRVLKNNHESLVYANNMLKALEEIPSKKAAFQLFEYNLERQEKNITEPGEKESTEALRKDFTELKANPADSSNYTQLRKSIQIINDLNQDAILRKNEIAQKTAEDARFWLTLIFTILIIVSITFIYNFPAVISEPVTRLAEGIREIANKNYKQRIYLEQKDEFGDLANSFNSMAEKLDEYESSNLAKIKFEKSRIETIINQMKDGIIGLDDKKHILFVNAVSEKILGLKESDIIGKYAADIAIQNDLMRTLLQDETRKELKIYADEKESFFNKDFINVKANDAVIGQVIVLRNITPYHELNEAKTNFIATVSHELKTPIASIRMSLQLLDNKQTGNVNTEQQLLLDSIKDDTNRLLKITGELLNMTQVDSGKIQLSVVSSDAKEILEYAVNANKSAAEQKNIQLDVDIAPNLPQVAADNEKTAWVLTNLLSNAIRYSYDNSTVFASIHATDSKIIFTVKDTGQGIAPEYKSKIFDRYFRVPGTHKEGTGLGLSICKEFIEAQGGQINVESDYGTGSSFMVVLNAFPHTLKGSSATTS